MGLNDRIDRMGRMTNRGGLDLIVFIPLILSKVPDPVLQALRQLPRTAAPDLLSERRQRMVVSRGPRRFEVAWLGFGRPVG